MSDVRRRNLIVLGAAALVSIGLAAFALEQRASQGAPHYTPAPFLPGFAANVKNAALIHVAGKDGAFDVTYTPQKGWVLPGRGNFPADFDEVRHTLIGLATLETIAPRTTRPDWLHYLNLENPPKGNAIAITVKDAKGAVLAALIAGNREDLGDPNGTQGLFVRRPGENQAWLARAVFVPQGDIASWLMTGVVQISAARLKDVAMTPLTGPRFTVSRAHPSQMIYTLAAAPKGSKPDARAINSVPYSLTTFNFTDVRPGKDMDFTKAAHAVAETFDGLAVTFDIASADGAVWARVSAAAAPGATPAVAQEAQGINARAAGWAFRLPPEKGKALLVDLPTLLKPPPPPPPGIMPGTIQMQGG